MATKREQVIAAAKREYQTAAAFIRSLTTEEAFVNDALRQAGELVVTATEPGDAAEDFERIFCCVPLTVG